MSKAKEAMQNEIINIFEDMESAFVTTAMFDDNIFGDKVNKAEEAKLLETISLLASSYAFQLEYPTYSPGTISGKNV